MYNSLIFSNFAANYTHGKVMMKSENTDEIKALKEALKREQEKNAKLEAKNTKLKAKHDADKAEIKKFKRHKAAKPLSAKKKEKMLRSMKPLGLSDLQKEKLEELFPGITSTSSLFD